MSKNQPPSPTQQARAERMREAATSGAQARSEIAANDIAVRKNMERLRALRLAKEASEPPMTKAKPAPKSGKKTAAKKSAGSLSDFLRDQKESGRRT